MTTTPTHASPSATDQVQRSLKDRAGYRFILVGVVLLVTAMTQLITSFDAAGSTATRVVHCVFAAIGVGLVVTGLIKERRR